MAGHDANVDGRSVIAAASLNPITLLSTIVSPAWPIICAPDRRQGTASPSNSPQTSLLNIPRGVTASTRETTTHPPRQPVAASNLPQTAAVTAATREATTELTKQPVAASNRSQKGVRGPNQRNQDASAWGRYAHERATRAIRAR